MLNESPVSQLEAAVDGRVINPDSDEYDEARRVWNGMVDRRPALIVQCKGGGEDIASALRFYREFAGDLPDEASYSAMIMKVPPAEPFPVEYHGQVAVALVGCHCGDIDDGMKFFEPLKKFGKPILADLRFVPYPGL